MTTLSTGVLLKLHDGMKTGAAKPVGEHRTAVLQVRDIVPAVMDEKDVFPRHGQVYKVSDSSNSIYAMLPPDQAGNSLKLGQYVHVDRLDPGSPFPVMVGAQPRTGRHPLVVGTGKKAAPRRGSCGPENHAAGVLASSKVVRPTALNFEDRTLVKERPNCAPPPAGSLASVRKSTSVMPRLVSISQSFAADRGDPPPSKIPRNPFPAEKRSMSCTASRATSKKMPSSSTVRVPVPAKLNAISKEALEQREQARKAEQEARHNASATENVFRICKIFFDVSKTATPDAPAACFIGFLRFDKEAARAVADIESILAATSMAATAAATTDEPATTHPAPPNILQEIAQNRLATARRRGLLGLGGVSKSASFAPGLNASRKCLAAADKANDKRSSAPAGPVVAQSPLGSSLRMAKQLQAEAGSWFMEFLEAALETGLKESGGEGGCLRLLMMQVSIWVEMEQIGGGESRKVGHPRAAVVARKLKMKAKNP